MEEKEKVLKTVTEIKMAIALLLIYHDKLKKGRDQSWVFKNEIYRTFNFHPQTLTDFLEKKRKCGLLERIWSWEKREPGGPCYRPTEKGQQVMENELKSLMNELIRLFA